MDTLLGYTGRTKKLFFPIFLTRNNGEGGDGEMNEFEMAWKETIEDPVERAWKETIERLFNVVHRLVVPMYTKVRYAASGIVLTTSMIPTFITS